MGEEGVDGVDRITAGRLAKLGRLEQAGVRAFPTTFSRSHRAQEIHADFDALNGQRVCVAGRLDVFRKLSSNLVFVEVKDESGRIQLMLHPRAMDDAQRLIYEALDPGDFVGACGTVIKSKTGEVTVEVTELSLLSKSLRNPPEKWHGLVDVETRYRQRYLDLMANVDTRQVFLTRSRIIAAIGRTRVRWNDDEIDFNPPWKRMPLRTAIAEFSGVDYAEYPDVGSLREAAERAGLHTEPEWNRGKIMDELLTVFVEPKLIQPTFLTDYPTDFPGSTLAKGNPDNPDEVERFEAFAGGIEFANAFSELNDPRVQRERFLQQVRAREAGDVEAQPFDQDFLTAMEHGMPPTGGLGVGIDRIAMLVTDQHTIRDVILFPQLRPRDESC